MPRQWAPTHSQAGQGRIDILYNHNIFMLVVCRTCRTKVCGLHVPQFETSPQDVMAGHLGTAGVSFTVAAVLKMLGENTMWVGTEKGQQCPFSVF